MYDVCFNFQASFHFQNNWAKKFADLLCGINLWIYLTYHGKVISSDYNSQIIKANQSNM